MSYINTRRKEHHYGNRTVADTVTPMIKYIKNGATANFAFPCWYLEVAPPHKVQLHSKRLHDHYGWPSPRHNDHIHQPYELIHEMLHDPYIDEVHNHHEYHGHVRSLIDMKKLIPIHLIEEGYTNVKVAFADTIEGLTVTSAHIDIDDDWVVRTIISAKVPAAIKEKVETTFSVIASRSDEAGHEINDFVNQGRLVILPSPFIA